MKALVCTQFGPPHLLEYREVPSPRPAANDVLVTVKAASVNFPDALIIENKYQVRPPLPFSPGSELAGIVKEVGGAVDGISVGDRVMALALHGAFAEEAVVDAGRVWRIPADVNDSVAAVLLMTYGTICHALRDRANVTALDTVLVLGAAGGIGVAAIEIAKAIGARVIACASSADKLEVCRRHGADAVINYSNEDFRSRLKSLTEGRGAEVIVDPVGGGMTELALRGIAWRGRLLVVGFASGDIPKIPLNLVLLKGCSIVGVFWGDLVSREPRLAASTVRQVTDWHRAGKIVPEIAAALPLARGAEAIGLVAGRKIAGKVIVHP